MTYDYKAKKVVAVLASDLEAGIALNVVGHLAISIATNGQELMGQTHYKDASGFSHAGFAKYPFIITKLKSSKLKTLVEEVRKHPQIVMSDYPEQVFTTAHDDELASAIEAARHEDMKYLGVILYGDNELLTKLTEKFTLWR